MFLGIRLDNLLTELSHVDVLAGELTELQWQVRKQFLLLTVYNNCQ